MIYLDPPYGIKFGSNWQVSTRHAPRRFRDALRQTRQTSASSRRSSRRSCRTWPRADIQNGRRDERLMCGILPGITVWDAIEEALRRHTPRTRGRDPVEPG